MSHMERDITQVRPAGAGSVKPSVVWGAIAATPLAILLSQLGLLFMFLGLFFFILFGLLIGAVMYRLGAPRRPILRTRLIAGGTAVAVFAWGLGLYVEARSLPGKVGVRVLAQTHHLPVDLSRDQALRNIKDQVQEYLRTHHLTSGLVGYVHWMVAGDPIAIGVTPDAEPVEYPTLQSPVGFAVRLILSLGLILAAILSQILSLQKIEDTPIVGQDDADDAAAAPAGINGNGPQG
jgi:hypothetical protein